jgi:fructosamine-3-kinase
MSGQETDISWQMLRRIVHDWLGTAAELAEVRTLSGGCISNTLSLKIRGGARAVIKISPHRVDRSYLQEAYQLNLLRSLGLPTPQVYSCKIGTLAEPHSYLLMEYLEGIDLAKARRDCREEDFDHLQMHLADLVLRLHANTSSCYARLSEEERQEFSSWPKFYRSVYDPIWKEAEKEAGLPVKMRKQIGKIHQKLDKILTHDDCPRLVHWDIWASNILTQADANGKWWVTALLDPNCKYAHAEAELAYLELFNTVSPAFMRVYQSAHRLPAEYQTLRKPIYQLYPLINHVQLFGQGYIKPLAAAVERAAQVV